MTFRGHLIGGGGAGIGVATLAIHWGQVPPDDLHTWVSVCATTVFFSLFPDLDTSSVPQRWFFRLVFIVLLYLAWEQRYELATLVGLLAVLPLLDHHRGWTHWKISPLIVSVLLGGVYEYWRARQAWMSGFSWDNVTILLRQQAIYLIACIVGWYTHLLLDGRFKLFPTAGDHH